MSEGIKCPRCTKIFTGANAEIVSKPESHGWVGPNGKMIYCAKATPEQLEEYKKVVEKVMAQRAAKARGTL